MGVGATPTAASPSRMTWQRQAVLDELKRSDKFRSAQQIHQALAEAGQDISLATVYRNLAHLRDAANVDVVLSSDGEAFYRLCEDLSHHHHLVCESCGGTVEVATKLLEQAISELAAAHDYTLTQHRVELFGLCPKCDDKK